MQPCGSPGALPRVPLIARGLRQRDRHAAERSGRRVGELVPTEPAGLEGAQGVAPAHGASPRDLKALVGRVDAVGRRYAGPSVHGVGRPTATDELAFVELGQEHGLALTGGANSGELHASTISGRVSLGQATSGLCEKRARGYAVGLTAGIAQLVEHKLPMLGVEGSNPFSRSEKSGRRRSAGLCATAADQGPGASQREAQRGRSICRAPGRATRAACRDVVVAGRRAAGAARAAPSCRRRAARSRAARRAARSRAPAAGARSRAARRAARTRATTNAAAAARAATAARAACSCREAGRGVHAALVGAVRRRGAARLGGIRRRAGAADRRRVRVSELHARPVFRTAAGILDPSEDLLLVGRSAANLGVPDAAARAVAGVAGVVRVGQAVVGPDRGVPVLDDAGLVVAHAFGHTPFARQNRGASRHVVDGFGRDALAIEGGSLALVHAARDLPDAIATVERNDGARSSAHLIGRLIRDTELRPPALGHGDGFEQLAGKARGHVVVRLGLAAALTDVGNRWALSAPVGGPLGHDIEDRLPLSDGRVGARDGVDSTVVRVGGTRERVRGAVRGGAHRPRGAQRAEGEGEARLMAGTPLR